MYTLGTTICGNDSIDFTTLSYQTEAHNIIGACLESNIELASGRFVYCPCHLCVHISLLRYYVAVEAVDHVGLSRVVCPDINFVVDNIPPQFDNVILTCLTVSGGSSVPLISWNIEALSEIVEVRYNISASSTAAENVQDFVQFPDAVTPVQSDYNLSLVLQGYSGEVYLTLQAESGAGLTTTEHVGSISCTG